MSTMINNKWAPQSFDDIVFESAYVRNYVSSVLVHGRQPDNLLLWGPPGSGKSSIVSIIAHSMASSNAVIPGTIAKIEPDSTEAQALAEIKGAFENACAPCIGPYYVLVDELDRFGSKLQTKLKALLDGRSNSRLLATVNDVSKIDIALRDRFRMFEVKVPTPEQFLTRAQLIMRTELPSKPVEDDHLRALFSRQIANKASRSVRGYMASLDDLIAFLSRKSDINPLS